MRPVSQTGVDAVQEACPVQCFVLVRVQRDATTLLRSPKLLTTQNDMDCDDDDTYNLFDSRGEDA